jgi:hypothetical protein
MGWKVDMTGDTLDKLDQPQFAPKGSYWTKLADATEDSKTGSMVLEFSILHGPCKDLSVTEKLQNSEFATDETKAKNIATKAKKWIGRLGAISKADEGKADVEPDFIRCIESEYILQLETREFTNEKGEKKQFTGCTYLGIWPLDHPDIPADVVAEVEAAAGKKLPAPRDGSVRGAKKTSGKAAGGSTGGATTPKPAANSGGSPAAGGAVDVAGLGL